MINLVVYIQGNLKNKTEFRIDENKNLSYLAEVICNSKLNRIVDELNDETHLYAFSESLKYGLRSKKYKKFLEIPLDEYLEDNERRCSETLIKDVFDKINQKLLFLFDFGASNHFIIRRTK